MSYRVISDSCFDQTDAFDTSDVVLIPLTLEVDDVMVVDDASFNQKEFIAMVEKSTAGAKSACPSPQAYADAFDCDAEDIYVVTLSANLSGSYNSARTGREMFLEEHPEKNIYIVDSCSAGPGQTLLVYMIKKFADEGLSFEEVVSKIEAFRDEMDTYFVIDSLETLRKNGRLTGLTAVIATVLNIKPIMGATNIGTIMKLDQARGTDRAIKRMIELIVEKTKNPAEKTVCITHVNCFERADKIRRILEGMHRFKAVMVCSAGGVTTCYANDGGIIISL